MEHGVQFAMLSCGNHFQIKIDLDGQGGKPGIVTRRGVEILGQKLHHELAV